MKNFTPEELGYIREDWRRNANLKEENRLQRVSELHACSPEDVAEAVRLEHFKQKEAFTKNIRKRTVKSYDQAVKDDCIKAVILDGESQTAVGERFGIPQNTISAWVKAAKKKQQEFLDYPEKVKEPEKVKTKPASDGEASTSSDSLRSAPEGELPQRGKRGQSGLSPQGEGFGGVDLKALEDAADGLLTFTDLFEEVGFLTAQQRRFIDELADQAGCYARGIRWALERSKR